MTATLGASSEVALQFWHTFGRSRPRRGLRRLDWMVRRITPVWDRFDRSSVPHTGPPRACHGPQSGGLCRRSGATPCHVTAAFCWAQVNSKQPYSRVFRATAVQGRPASRQRQAASFRCQYSASNDKHRPGYRCSSRDPLSREAGHPPSVLLSRT